MEAVAKGLKGILGDDDFVEGEKVLRIDLSGRHQEVGLDVAGGKESVFRELGCNDQRLAGPAVGTGNKGKELLGLWFLDLEGVDHEDITGKDSSTESLSEGKLFDCFRSLFGIFIKFRLTALKWVRYQLVCRDIFH